MHIRVATHLENTELNERRKKNKVPGAASQQQQQQ